MIILFLLHGANAHASIAVVIDYLGTYDERTVSFVIESFKPISIPRMISISLVKFTPLSLGVNT